MTILINLNSSIILLKMNPEIKRRRNLQISKNASVLKSDNYFEEFESLINCLSAKKKEFSKQKLLKEFKNFLNKSLIYSEFIIKKMTRFSQISVENLTFNIKNEETFYMINKIFNINFCYISLYENAMDPKGFSKLILSYSNNQFFLDLNTEKKFPLKIFCHSASLFIRNLSRSLSNL